MQEIVGKLGQALLMAAGMAWQTGRTLDLPNDGELPGGRRPSLSPRSPYRQD
jgi:hypothetical protein